jgi:hypothetical protein
MWPGFVGGEAAVDMGSPRGSLLLASLAFLIVGIAMGVAAATTTSTLVQVVGWIGAVLSVFVAVTALLAIRRL